MIDENVNGLTSYVRENVTQKQFDELEGELRAADETKAEKVKSAKLKKPFYTVLFSAILGLFGGGSFYLGQIKRGIVKVVFNVVVPILIVCIFLVTIAPNNQRYADQALEYKANVTDAITEANNTLYSGYTSQYNSLNNMLSAGSNDVSIDKQAGIIADAYYYFSGAERPAEDAPQEQPSDDEEQVAEDGDGTSEGEEQPPEEDQPADVNFAATLTALNTALQSFADTYVVGISESYAVAESVLMAAAKCIADSQDGINSLVASTLSAEEQEDISEINSLLEAISTGSDELEQSVQNVRGIVTSLNGNLDAEDEADETYAAVLTGYLEHLNINDGALSQEDSAYLSQNADSLTAAVGYVYDKVEAEYAEDIADYIAVTYTDGEGFIASLAPDAVIDDETLTYSDVYAPVNSIMAWLAGSYVAEEGDADYDEIQAVATRIAEYRQNFYLVNDMVSVYNNLNTATGISVPEVENADNLVSYLLYFANLKYDRTEQGILEMVEALSAATNDAEFLAELEQFAEYCEGYGEFTSSRVGAAANSAANYFNALHIILSGEVTEENSGLLAAISGSYEDMSDELLASLSVYSQNLDEAFSASQDFYRNFAGYTDSENEDNNITGLLNAVIATADDGNVTVTSFISDFTQEIQNISDACGAVNEPNNAYRGNSLLEQIPVVVEALESARAQLPVWYLMADTALTLTEDNDVTLIGESIDDKLYEDVNLNGNMQTIVGYLNSAVQSDNYDVINSGLTSAVSATASFGNELESAADGWQFTHDWVHMFFLILIIIDAVIIAAYWVGEVFRDREKCYKMNYESIKKALND